MCLVIFYKIPYLVVPDVCASMFTDLTIVLMVCGAFFLFCFVFTIFRNICVLHCV